MEQIFVLAFLGINSWKDIRKREVSLLATGIFAVIGIINALWHGTIFWEWIGAVGFGTALIALSVVSKGAVGMGDGLVLAALGTVLTFGELLGVFMMGLLCCSVWGIILLILPRTGRKTEIPFVPFLLLGFFAYCAAEATTMQWASTYFVEVKGIAADRAAGFAALFYIGITAGRFISGIITDRLGDRKMILLGTGILVCGIFILCLPVESYTVAFAAFLVIGLGCAPIYPCIIHSTPYNFGAENSGAIIGIQMASAYVGSTFIPPLFGLLGNAVSFSILPVYLLGFVVLMITMVETTFRITRKEKVVKI